MCFIYAPNKREWGKENHQLTNWSFWGEGKGKKCAAPLELIEKHKNIIVSLDAGRIIEKE